MTKPLLDYLFKPSSIAIAGVSTDTSRSNPAQKYLQSLTNFGFKGRIYPLNPAGGEIFGIKVYKNLGEISGAVDYVVSAIPARKTPQLMSDCVLKGVKAVHLFTAGYSEIEDEIGEELESEILGIAKKGGMRLLGPNCMGLYCPESGLTFAVDYPEQKGFPARSGGLGLISQSGGNCIFCIREAAERGLFFSKVVSYGNASDLNECDFLDYMIEDPETKVIAMYVEGVKDGARFIETLKRAVTRKPVIINKAGNTPPGARVCASHTSAIAGSADIWRDFLKQVGAIQVGSMAELVDVSLAFFRVPAPAGRNTVVIGSGGGISVHAADEVTRAGLYLPDLPLDVRRKMNILHGTEAGNIFRNPVDIAPFENKEAYINTAKAIADCKETDILIMHFAYDIWSMGRRKNISALFVEIMTELTKEIEKPLVCVLHLCVTLQARQLADEVRQKFLSLGLPIYSSIERAASALNKYITYNERIKRI